MAYGDRLLKLEDGTKICMPNVVRTATNSQIIDDYLKMCENENIEAIKRSKRFDILKIIAVLLSESA